MDGSFSGAVLPIKTAVLDIRLSNCRYCSRIDRNATRRAVYSVLKRHPEVSVIVLCHSGKDNGAWFNVCPLVYVRKIPGRSYHTFRTGTIAPILNNKIVVIVKIVSFYSREPTVLSYLLACKEHNVRRLALIIKSNRHKFICRYEFRPPVPKWFEDKRT